MRIAMSPIAVWTSICLRFNAFSDHVRPKRDGAFGYALRHLKILGHRENKSLTMWFPVMRFGRRTKATPLQCWLFTSGQAPMRVPECSMVFTVSAALSGSAVFTPYGYAIPAMMANLSYGR